MKRSFPPTREGLVGLAAVAIVGLACEPDNGVKPGAPVLTQIVITQAGGASTTITSETPDCAAGIVGAEACDPAADSLCRQVAAMNFCNCLADATDMTMGLWDCSPFANVTGVVAVFDRVLDTAPFDMGDPSGIVDFADVSAGAGAPPFSTVSDYAANGTPNGLITVLGGLFFGNVRLPGPSVLTAGVPAFPSGTTVTVRLEGTEVRAKDGHTPFRGDGLLQDGTISFTTAAFSASISPPDPAAPDMTPATVAFTNFVDPATIVDHVHVTSNGAAFAGVDVTSDGATATVTPTTAWPASATIVVTVDATAENLLGQTIAAPAMATFMTAAM
jgi:hypothetical protein